MTKKKKKEEIRDRGYQRKESWARFIVDKSTGSFNLELPLEVADFGINKAPGGAIAAR